MISNFFSAHLQTVESRIASSKAAPQLMLDKNEQSDDLDTALKARVMGKLMQANWNRYPAADHKDIEQKIAEYCGLEAENIALSAGSASLITTLLNYFALNNKHICITQPSYSLFDYHCKTYNIPYEPWYLSPELEYDYQTMPTLGKDSVLIVTSPNNPVGNSIDLDKLEALLSQYPESIIVLDAVYCEFANIDPTFLVKKYPNLIMLRSFSKAFPVAGLRLGYLCAAPETTAIVRKLILQFSINHFTLICAREMLYDQGYMDNAKKRVQQIISERERMYHLIRNAFGDNMLTVYKSEGNFLLIRLRDKAVFEQLMEDLNKQGIKVLNTSAFALMNQTFRVSIGNALENEVFFRCMKNSLLSAGDNAAEEQLCSMAIQSPGLVGI